ncbi:RYamide receptor-like [Nilaparvata lugens]|uniref:RYamide receptor-like n=1 Tax=Nilaparvata lugens TaxID=108931 RepID=UPI00193DFACA|nr:RYamide receptor-like [Nilaparvata lugens]
MDSCMFSDNSSCPFYEDRFTNDSSGLNDSSWPACSDGVPGMLFSAYFQAAIYLTYSAIFVVALVGNGLVCYVVLSSARMRTVTNIFIVNLAVGDIMMTVLCVPFSFVSTLILQYWPFGAPLCHTVSFSQAVSVLVSAYTLVAISVDRYMAIMWPLRPRMGKRHAKVVILLVWVVAIATALPIPLVTRLYEPSPWHTTCQRSVCNEHWDSNLARVVYGVTLLVLQYAVPFLVLVFTYTSIAVVVWGKRPPGEAENARDTRIARSKRKVNIIWIILKLIIE